MIDGVDSQTASVGQDFAGSLDAPVVDSNGQTIIPRGADVVLKLVDAKQSGKIAGRTELALSMMSVRVNGQLVDIRTQTVTEKSTNRAGRSAGAIGGGAVGGAVLGGILGGGKGAAIGAGAGAAGGREGGRLWGAVGGGAKGRRSGPGREPRAARQWNWPPAARECACHRKRG